MTTTLNTPNTWQQFLTEHIPHGQALLTNNGLAHYGNQQTELNAAASENILVDLSHRALLKISGEDAVTFLQGQVTNDVKLLDASHSHFTGYCSAKGRLLALFFAFTHGGNIHLQFDRSLLESIMKRLKMYVLRAKVVISDETHQVRIGIAGQSSEASLISLFGQIPEHAHDVITVGETTVLRLPSTAQPAFMLMTNVAQAMDIWQTLEKTHSVVGQNAWDWLETQAGIPEIVSATQEAFVPQMVNLDVLGAINFKKGCYTGQEIVARTHYLGKVKRRTQLAHVASTTMPVAGDNIVDAGQQIIGQVVRACPALIAGFDVLIECRLDSLSQGQLFWTTHALSIKSLPYAVEDSK
jgi:folate-binding protein YgfZ